MAGIGAAIISGVGGVFGAAGDVIGGITAGTQDCGARPLLRKNREAYDECVKSNTEIRLLQAQTQADFQKNVQPPTQPNPKLLLGIAIAVIILIIILKRN
jgi:hypothetical protein